jgi:putative ABC transport system permease protein
MKALHLVWRNLLRRKIRTTFTLLTVLIGFILFGATMAIRAAFSMGVEIAGQDRLMTIHKVSLINLLPKSYLERIRSLEGVKEVSHSNWFGGYYQDPSNLLTTMAVDPESWLRTYPDFVVPEEQKKAWFADRTGCIVGVELAKRFNWKVGDRIPLISPLYRKPDGSPWTLTIDGMYDSPIKGTDRTQLFFHYEYINETFRSAVGIADQVGWYVVQVEDPATSDKLAKQIDAMFANSPSETKTATEKAFISDWAKQVGDIGTIMIAVAVMVMGFILLVTGNTMAQSIRERTNELAILKTLGYGDGRILALVLLESCAIAILGGGIGLAISWFVVAQGDPTGGLLPAFYFPVRDLFAGVALILLLGLATGIIPALQASRLKIVDALGRR